MSLLPRPKMPRIPGGRPSVTPALSEAEKAIRRQKNAKRKKKCVKATSFPCGFTCLPKMTKSGKETICRNILRGQAKTFTQWLSVVQERASQANNRRLAKGKSGIYIHDVNTKGKLAGSVGIIGREPQPKVRKNARKSKPVEEPIAVPQREPVRVIEKDILTDRSAFLPSFNPTLVPQQLRQHLSKEGMEGVSRAIKAMDSVGGFLLADGTGIGKELHVDEPILTENGWVRIGDIRVGDRVYGRDGELHNVTGYYPQGVKPLYRITFSDGASVLAGLEHQWAAQISLQASVEGDYWNVHTTQELLEFQEGEFLDAFIIPIADRNTLIENTGLDVPNIEERYFKSIKYELDAEAACIAVDAPDSLYITRDFIVTHNTRQQLSVAQRYAEQGKKVLIISPNAVIKPDYNRGTVSGSFADDSKTMGVNINLNKGDRRMEQGEIHLATYQNLDKLKEQVDSNTVLILDEAHNLKNLSSQRTQHGMEMLDKASSVLYATATPADKPEHLYYLHRLGRKPLAQHMGIKEIETQNPDGTLTKKWGREKTKAPKKPKAHGAVGRYVERQKHKDKKKEKIDKGTQDAIAVSNLFDDLTSSGTMIRREISMKGVKVNMTAIAVPESAQEIMDKIEERYAKDRASTVAARTLMDQRRQLEPFKVPEASRLAIDAIKKGRQVLIFADRVNTSTVRGATTPEQDRMNIKGKVIAESGGTIGLLRKQLEAQGIKPEDIVEMHGQSDVSQAEALRRFQSGEAKVMIGTPQVMGTGINADDNVGDRPRTTIVMTPPFSASDLMQILGRTWRKNTNSIPDFHILFTDLGIDQWGKALLSEKLATLGAAVGGSPKDLKFSERNLRGYGFHFQYV